MGFFKRYIYEIILLNFLNYSLDFDVEEAREGRQGKKFHKFAPFINSHCRYNNMAEILPTLRKTLYNQSIIIIQ